MDALLNACQMHGNVELHVCAANKLSGLDLADSGILMRSYQICMIPETNGML